MESVDVTELMDSGDLQRNGNGGVGRLGGGRKESSILGRILHPHHQFEWQRPVEDQLEWFICMCPQPCLSCLELQLENFMSADDDGQWYFWRIGNVDEKFAPLRQFLDFGSRQTYSTSKIFKYSNIRTPDFTWFSNLVYIQGTRGV